MVSISDVQLIDDYQSLTPQQIAEALNDMAVTVKPIDLDYLLFLLNNRGMLVRLIRPADEGEKWAGTVVNMIVYVNANVPSMAGPINQWFSHITNDRNHTFDTTMSEYGSQLKAIAEQFGGQEGMPSVDDFAAIVELGGGWRFGNVTAGDVTDALSADAASRRESSRIAAINNAMDAVRGSVDLADESLSLADVQSAISDALAAGWSE